VNREQPAPDLDLELCEKFRQVSLETIATQLFKRGLRQQFLVGVTSVKSSVDRFVGTAFTMRFIPAREDLDTLEGLHGDDNLQWAAVEQVGPGQVLMVDSCGSTQAATAGDMLVTRAMYRGAVAFVTDGAFRDGVVLRSLGIPTYARAITATTRLSRFHVADLQVPIGCAGVAVYPGDVIVGDVDGIIVVPRGLAEEIVEPALAQEKLEKYLHTRVHNGEALTGLYPPNASTLGEYEKWRSE
jgi:regulator of RNase E activity RraA